MVKFDFQDIIIIYRILAILSITKTFLYPEKVIVFILAPLFP